MQTQLRLRVAGALLSFACLLCNVTGARATVFDLHNPLSGLVAIIAPHSTGASFTDTWNFTVNGSTHLDTFVAPYDVTGTQYFGIANLQTSLYHAATTNVQIGGLFNGGVTATYSGLTPGNYFLQVTGNPTGSMGGVYVGHIFANVTPVPEPEVWAMMLIGFGLIRYRLSRSSAGAGLRMAAA